METLIEENNTSEKPEKCTKNVSIDMIKKIFTETFKVQEEPFTKIVCSCNTNTIARLDRLIEEI